MVGITVALFVIGWALMFGTIYVRRRRFAMVGHDGTFNFYSLLVQGFGGLLFVLSLMLIMSQIQS